jgi:ribosomal protein L18E
VSKTNRPPVSISKIVENAAGPHTAKAQAGKTIVVVGTVTDDNSMDTFLVDVDVRTDGKQGSLRCPSSPSPRSA